MKKIKKILLSFLGMVSACASVAAVVSCTSAQPLRSPLTNPTFTTKPNTNDLYIANALANWYNNGGVNNAAGYTLSSTLSTIVKVNGTITKNDALSELLYIFPTLFTAQNMNPKINTNAQTNIQDATISYTDSATKTKYTYTLDLNETTNSEDARVYNSSNIGYDIVNLNNNHIAFYVSYWGKNSDILVQVNF